MKNKLIAAIVASALVSPLAFAKEGPSYSYVEGGYVSYDSDFDLDTDGFRLGGSAELGEHFFVVANYADTEGDSEGFNFDFDVTGFGFGVKFDQASGNSWYASYSLNSWDIEGEDFDVDTLRFGYRAQMTNNVELNASISSNDVEGLERENGYQVGLVYGINESLKFVVDYDTIAGDLDVDMLSIGIRKTF